MPKLSDIFDVRNGNAFALNSLKRTGPDGIPFVSRKMGDNGIAAYVEPIPGIDPNPAGDLSCALSGNGVLSTFIQDRPFYTGYHIACLRPKRQMKKSQLLYYCAAIAENRYRYSWGRQANRSIGDIQLPALSDLPQWIASADPDQFLGANAPAISTPHQPLSVSGWRSFRYDTLFDIERGRGPRAKDLTGAGDTPFVTSSDRNNGWSGVTEMAPCHPGNVIGVNRNGSVGEAFYQPRPFCSTEDVHVFHPKFVLTPKIGLFLCTLIRLEKPKFGYGRKWGLDRMNASTIRLPVDKAGKPDWNYMEDYIASLPFSSQV